MNKSSNNVTLIQENITKIENNYSLFKSNFDNAEYVKSEDLGNIKQLPDVTAADNGKTLQVVNGSWALVTLQAGGQTEQGEQGEALAIGYIKLNRVISTGQQYIDTGILPDNNTIIEIKVKVNSSGDNIVFGVNDGTNKYTANVYRYGLYPRYGANVPNTSVGSVSSSEFVIIKVENGDYSIDGVVNATYSDVFTCNKPLYLFANNNNGTANYNASCEFEYAKITQNGVLVRDFVPCRELNSNTIGLYDKVSDTFYANNGTGSFTT